MASLNVVYPLRSGESGLRGINQVYSKGTKINSFHLKRLVV